MHNKHSRNVLYNNYLLYNPRARAVYDLSLFLSLSDNFNIILLYIYKYIYLYAHFYDNTCLRYTYSIVLSESANQTKKAAATRAETISCSYTRCSCCAYPGRAWPCHWPSWSVPILRNFHMDSANTSSVIV